MIGPERQALVNEIWRNLTQEVDENLMEKLVLTQHKTKDDLILTATLKDTSKGATRVYQVPIANFRLNPRGTIRDIVKALVSKIK